MVLGHLQLLRRILGLIAPPSQHQVRYAGMLAPASKLRARLRPGGRIAVQGGQDCRYESVVPPRRRVPWAELLAKSYDGPDIGSAGEGRKPESAGGRGLSGPRYEGRVRPMEFVLPLEVTGARRILNLHDREETFITTQSSTPQLTACWHSRGAISSRGMRKGRRFRWSAEATPDAQESR